MYFLILNLDSILLYYVSILIELIEGESFLSSALFKAHFNLSSLLFSIPFTPANLFLKMLIPYLLCLISFKSDMCSKAFIVHHRYKNTFLFLIYNVQKQILNTSQIFQYQPPTVMPLSILSVVPHIFLFHDPHPHSHFFPVIYEHQ